MSDNPLSGYSDAQALRLLWDMAAGVRLELEAAKKRIRELEQECEKLRAELEDTQIRWAESQELPY